MNISGKSIQTHLRPKLQAALSQDTSNQLDRQHIHEHK